MYAAIIKLNTLTNPVGASTQHHDLVTLGWLCLTFFFIGRIHVGRAGRKFRCTGVDPFVNRTHSDFMPMRTQFFFIHVEQLGQAPIRKTLAFQITQACCIHSS